MEEQSTELELTAINNYLLVSLLAPKQELASGIILPEKSLDRPRWAVVLSVGEGAADFNGVRHRPPFSPGDIVFIFRHAPVKVAAKGEYEEEIFAIGEGDVWCKMIFVAAAEDPDQKVPQLLPMGNLLHIAPIIDEAKAEKTAGGIYLPQQTQEKPNRARVLAVGPGMRADNGNYVAPSVFPGDIVRYQSAQTLEVTFTDLGDSTGRQLMVMTGDCMAIERQSPGENATRALVTILDEAAA